MLKKYKNIIVYTMVFLLTLYVFLYSLGILIIPPQHFAIPKILRGSSKIKEFEIGILRLNSEEDCSIFQKSLINVYYGHRELLKKSYRALGGHIITNDGLKLRMSFYVCNEKQNTISISFNDMENEFYIVELPQSIADSLYDKIK